MSARLPICGVLLLLSGWLHAAEPSSRGLGLFKDYVEPLLQKRCYECHSHEAKKAKGGLVVDSRNGLLKGGDLGAAVVPGKTAESLLLKAISYTDPDLAMPPKGKLSADEIAHIREWIELGAPDPRTGPEIAGNTVTVKKGPSAADLWSVRPLQQAAVPPVKQSDWPRTDVDRFLLAAMEAKNLTPSPDAAPHTILRRLHEVLTGLPPSMAEVEAFPAAAARDLDGTIAGTIDALMQTRHFGERWGRNWLDVARYADVSGSTVPEPFPAAWRYRDYVIHAFNSDKPWERFVREQIAGDLLPSSNGREKAEQQIATGYLALGHVVAQDRDAEKLKLDAMDEHLDVLGKTFLGIQISCARCHDHKIDPFPTREYYALAGIMRSTRTLKGADVAQEHVVPEDVALADDDAADSPAWLRGGEGVKVHAVSESGAPRDEPIHLRGEQDKLGEVVPRGFPTLVKVSATKRIPPAASGRAELAEWLLAEDNVLVQRVIVNRVWHHVFGQGLVRSTDNFGLTGDAPSHPELLDFLARRFREVHRGSFKSFIRELLLSHAFRQDSAVRGDMMAVEPQNRLLWRANVRRRDAEALIDSIRQVAGTLDLRPSEFNVPKFKVGNTGSTANIDIPGDVLQRRALYWPVFRKDVPIGMDILGIFDFPAATAPRGSRGITRVPSQSLALLNAPMVLDAANALAASLPESDDASRVGELYLRVLARRPTAEECTKAIAFLTSFQAELVAAKAATTKTPRTVAWNRLSHVLLTCNEFVALE